jgi:hypothetical protein
MPASASWSLYGIDDPESSQLCMRPTMQDQYTVKRLRHAVGLAHRATKQMPSA